MASMASPIPMSLMAVEGTLYHIPSVAIHPLHYLFVTLLLVLAAYSVVKTTDPDGIPRYPSTYIFDPFSIRHKVDYIRDAAGVLARGRVLFPNTPYWLTTDSGEILVLNPETAHEVKNDHRLHYLSAAAENMHGYIPGFEPFKPDPKVPRVVQKYLIKAQNRLLGPCSRDAATMIQRTLTDSPEWHPVHPQKAAMRIVSRMASRPLVGDMCEDDSWTALSTSYTYDAFLTGAVIRMLPRAVRPHVHHLIPTCYSLRRKLARCREIVGPVIASRLAARDSASPPSKAEIDAGDAIDWMAELARDEPDYDAAVGQLTLSAVSIHTTSDLLQQTMTDIALHPEILPSLRAEVARVFATHGSLTKAALHELVLLDSVIKESQRLRPVGLGVFFRTALTDITLSSGAVVRAGTVTMADLTHQWSPAYWGPDAAVHDPFRFARLREEGRANTQLVSTSPAHMGFGHGEHACPGRFFAAAQIKIALAHMLLKYDWRMPDGFVPRNKAWGIFALPDPETRLLFRRRVAGEVEVDLDSSII